MYSFSITKVISNVTWSKYQIFMSLKMPIFPIRFPFFLFQKMYTMYTGCRKNNSQSVRQTISKLNCRKTDYKRKTERVYNVAYAHEGWGRHLGQNNHFPPAHYCHYHSKACFVNLTGNIFLINMERIYDTQSTLHIIAI